MLVAAMPAKVMTTQLSITDVALARWIEDRGPL
jgi:hypothetical protein